MIFYFILIFLPFVFAFITSDKNSGQQERLLFIVGLFYVLFIGLRYEVGMDRANYVLIYNDLYNASFDDAFNRVEPLFALLDMAAIQVNMDMSAVNFVAAIIFVLGLVKFAQKMPLPFIALISVTPYLVTAISMSAVRQSIALGLVFLMMSGLGKNSTSKNVFLVALATGFHYSAFFTILFVFQGVKLPGWLKWLLIFVFSAVSIVVLSGTEQATIYYDRYSNADNDSSGAFQHVALNVIPAVLYLFFIKKWQSVYGDNDLMRLLSYLSLLSVAGVMISSTAFDRLALYLSPIQMMVYGTIPIVFKSQAYTVAIFVFNVLTLYVWLAYSNSAGGWLPYQNLLFI